MGTATLLNWTDFVKKLKQLENSQELTTSPYKIRINDINKALLKLYNQHKKTDEELKATIPREFHDIIPSWKVKEAVKLPVHRPGVDHQIEIEKDHQASELKIPFGSLFNMSREELIVQRKTLNDLLDKGYLYASKYEVGAPALFVRKPGGGVHFCYDYIGLMQ